MDDTTNGIKKNNNKKLKIKTIYMKLSKKIKFSKKFA